MTDEERVKFIEGYRKEVRRIVNVLRRKMFSRTDYDMHCRPSFSMAHFCKTTGLTFNALRAMEGLPIRGKGNPSSKKVKVHEVGEIRDCNKCLRPFHRTPQNRIICPPCTSANRQYHTEGGGVWMNGNDNLADRYEKSEKEEKG